MRGAEINAIGRLGDGAAPWFGIARERADERGAGAYTLVFGEANGAVVSAPPESADPQRGLLLALIAFFEGEARDPPPELEMTHWDAAEAVRWLAAHAGAETARATALSDAADAIDDGLPTDVVTGHLYRALESSGVSDTGRTSPVSELRRTYERLGR